MCNLMENISVKENGNNGVLWDLFIFPWTVYYLCVTLFTCTIYAVICTCLQLPTNVFLDQSRKNLSHCKSICATLIITIAAKIYMFIVICKFMWSFYLWCRFNQQQRKDRIRRCIRSWFTSTRRRCRHHRRLLVLNLSVLRCRPLHPRAPPCPPFLARSEHTSYLVNFSALQSLCWIASTKVNT